MALRGIVIFSIVLFAGIATPTAQEIENSVDRILNGLIAKIEDFPFQASLRKGSMHTCGGSIISQKHILTAGHCVANEVSPYTSLKVVTGARSRLRGGTSHKIAKITVHPLFFTDGNRGVNDIAVITLHKKITFNSSQKKINLPKRDFIVGQKVNLTGWGRTRQSPPIRPLYLQKLETKLISVEECQKSVIDPVRTKIDDRDVCTVIMKGAGMCLGDSGGPLSSNGELVGIVSWTDGDFCAGGHPDVYTNVFRYRHFIDPILKEKA